MHRIDGPGHLANQFTEGDPQIGQQPTTVTADFMNAVQEEIAGVIEGAGITLVKGQQDQLLAALAVLFAGLGADGFVPSGQLNPIWTSPVLVGNALTIAGLGSPALARLNDTDVALIDQFNVTLRTYRFTGLNWTLVGSGLVIPSLGPPDLTALNGTDVALVDSGTNQLRTYRFNGATWSIVGNAFSTPLGGGHALTALSSTDVALFDGGNTSLRVYRFDGTNWAQVGNSFAVPTGGALAGVVALGPDTIAWAGQTSNELRIYRFDGTDWTQVGNSFDLVSVLNPAFACLSSTDFVILNGGTGEFGVFRFDGADVTRVGRVGIGLNGGIGGGVAAITAMNGTDVAFINDAADQLTWYRFGFSLRVPFYPS